MKKKTENYLFEELKNSFSHTKHLEQQRTNYMGFYFALLIGLFSVSISVLKIDLANEIIISIICSLSIITSLITTLLLAAIKKISFANQRHTNKIRWIRKQFLKGNKFDHETMCGEFNNKHMLDKSKLFKVQLSFEIILIAFALFFSLPTLFFAIYNLMASCNCTFLTITIFQIAVLIYLFLIASKKIN